VAAAAVRIGRRRWRLMGIGGDAEVTSSFSLCARGSCPFLSFGDHCTPHFLILGPGNCPWAGYTPPLYYCYNKQNCTVDLRKISLTGYIVIQRLFKGRMLPHTVEKGQNYPPNKTRERKMQRRVQILANKPAKYRREGTRETVNKQNNSLPLH